MTFSPFRLQPDILRARLERLTTRTAKLSQDYDSLMSRVGQLEVQAVCNAGAVEQEGRLMGLIELLMRDDVRANIITDYVIMFFRLVLLKMREQGQDFVDVHQLFKALTEDRVSTVFRKILSSLDFPDKEQHSVMTLLEAIKHRQLPAPETSEVVTSSPAGDAQISSALLYLRAQHDLDPDINACLRHAICVAHESVLSDTAVREVMSDVNVNSCHVIHHLHDGTLHADHTTQAETGVDVLRAERATATEKTCDVNPFHPYTPTA